VGRIFLHRADINGRVEFNLRATPPRAKSNLTPALPKPSWGTESTSRDAGFPYEYKNSPYFPNSPNFRPAPGNIPQVGDVGRWNGHMVIYDPNAGETHTRGVQGNSLSAFREDYDSGPARYQWFEKQYGPVQWFRYYQPSGY